MANQQDAPDLSYGLGLTRHHPATPEGQIEQAGLVASRILRLTGWRRLAAQVAVIVFILLMVLLGTGPIVR